jgi:hypothetical protein
VVPWREQLRFAAGRAPVVFHAQLRTNSKKIQEVVHIYLGLSQQSLWRGTTQPRLPLRITTWLPFPRTV